MPPVGTTGLRMFTALFPDSFSSSGNVFSIITTASAPRGITPPVAIIVAVPLVTEFWGTTPQARTSGFKLRQT